ncbi:MAG TPA: TRAP transporter large permease [Acetobacteraceae bacterium]|nr:TRAP transporter large permease [Acetobacteraceae bacterium]
MTSNETAIVVMCGIFLALGYAGLPVAFALIAAVVVVAGLFTDLTIGSLMGQLFNGINELALLAIPFFLLVGEIMTAARITPRLIALTQAMVGHLRSGLAHVVAVSCMIFGGISGSSTADTVAIGTILMPAMTEEGYAPEFSAALIAAGASIASMVPPSIMAIVYGAVGDASVGGLFLGGAVPGLMVCIGLMIYSYFFGAPGVAKRRASLFEFAASVRGAALPLMIPVIIIGSILGGVITPAEAGMAAVVYTLIVLLPAINRTHYRRLPRDIAMAAVMYAIPLTAVAGASAFGWMLAYLGGADIIMGWVRLLGTTDARAILFFVAVLFLIVGDFLDGLPAIIILMPVILSLEKLGHINSVHMGVVVIVTLAFGLITPPCGIILLLSSSLAGVPFSRALRRSLPIYVVFAIVISIIILLPDTVLFLPRHFLPRAVGCFPRPHGGGWICP